MTTKPKFFNKNGDLSAYSLCCGYIQRATSNGEKYGHCDTSLDLEKDSACYHVKLFSTSKNLKIWDSFDNLTEARKKWRRYKTDYKLVRI